jgi:hypothetical protein
MMRGRVRTITLVTLLVLLGLPLSGTVCAAWCDASAHTREGSAQHCDTSTDAPGAARLNGVRAHDCDHRGAVSQATEIAVTRANAGTFVEGADVTHGSCPLPTVSPRAHCLEHGASPASSPPVGPPLVLRV